ncbi:MAG TPA: hypothetical protein PKC98_06720, partial [Candidatus Melainabacteria bacterium]|nr:hypothetical protein [Candidatus Melainabacteria bacterium]
MKENETPEEIRNSDEKELSVFNKTNMVTLAIVIAVAGIAFFFLWKKHSRPLVDTRETPDVAVSVPVATVVKKTLFREDQIPGEIDAYQDVLIYPKVPGFIQWIGVDRGSVV